MIWILLVGQVIGLVVGIAVGFGIGRHAASTESEQILKNLDVQHIIPGLNEATEFNMRLCKYPLDETGEFPPGPDGGDDIFPGSPSFGPDTRMFSEN